MQFKKTVLVLAPTGIAAFNVVGDTMHRILSLPLEHGKKIAKYFPLSAIQHLRDELNDVALIIVDEVSMVSNVNFMYMHMRLTEIFNTFNCENGFFGKKHILLFGDLLQLPPVGAPRVFLKMDRNLVNKSNQSMGSYDLWSLFEYDELTINMRQKGDETYQNILQNIRIGEVKQKDIDILLNRLIPFESLYTKGKLKEVFDYLSDLPNDTLCILPKNDMCESINASMLERIDSEDILLQAIDNIMSVDHHVKQQGKKLLQNLEDDVSRTAGLPAIIKLKIGAKVMLRRNIDTSLGLVNGAVAKVISISKDLFNELCYNSS